MKFYVATEIHIIFIFYRAKGNKATFTNGKRYLSHIFLHSLLERFPAFFCPFPVKKIKNEDELPRCRVNTGSSRVGNYKERFIAK